MALPDLGSLGARPFWFGGVEFRLAPLGGLRSGALVVVKPLEEVERYQELLERFDAPRIVEMGIAYGGSVALFSLMAQPERLVAIELNAEREPVLDEFIAEHRLGDRVHLHYGTDQADTVRLAAIVDAEFDGVPLDLVIDDASHLYDETLASFEALFPRLRPGGEYVIEDWSCDHGIRALLAAGLADPDHPTHAWAAATLAGEGRSRHAGQTAQTEIAAATLGGPTTSRRPLTRLALQLVLASAEPDSGVAHVETGPYWTKVTRDQAPLAAGTWRLADTAPDHFGQLA
ncbi:MAG: class I SAM-dependent methyltransferase [Acidimicrobiales bacterium]